MTSCRGSGKSCHFPGRWLCGCIGTHTRFDTNGWLLLLQMCNSFPIQSAFVSLLQLGLTYFNSVSSDYVAWRGFSSYTFRHQLYCLLRKPRLFVQFRFAAEYILPTHYRIFGSIWPFTATNAGWFLNYRRANLYTHSCISLVPVWKQDCPLLLAYRIFDPRCLALISRLSESSIVNISCWSTRCQSYQILTHSTMSHNP